jgi:2-keto-4-pentenoate hydratase/2-oxohepta-3-ene-1,7-dioic acid hydratase in catechol pathway
VGFAQKPPAPLNVGDVVKVEIDRLGFIENEVIQEPAEAAQFF